MPDLPFSTASELAKLINAYFNKIEEKPPAKSRSTKELKQPDAKTQKIRGPEPATIAGLAFFLGFNSIGDFYDYESDGEFANELKRGRLRIVVAYEKKLHQSATGVIFGLRNLGWNGKSGDKAKAAEVVKNLKIEITEAGPKLAGSEDEVVL